ncbi:mycofactocin biosynthesis peptidyl-dipeptidase MftE [Subtercola endophyticus]|uniref:mycofactocin biosynthesis peptidyl-dipeptidase MftE n=1 Tax=Subtercola endophyticus TaxID=2895559 RepID=UPI001E48B00D|nr:mycofactocin biosynthesis peptidyl-dipeptidase MftE [Subtercola endophyticus]UFS58309.1 mycofactocin biosynthesis peptidyl-dipeptidase MftE [Subtercola endophyticus]
MSEVGRRDLATLSVTTLGVGTPGVADARPTVLVPTGSTEQHGPHLPFATDTVIAAAVASAVAERLNTSADAEGAAGSSASVSGASASGASASGASASGAAASGAWAPGASHFVVAPALPYGASGEHQPFAGTVSIGHDALKVVLVELVRSLSTWAGRIVFVNGHGGNVPSLMEAVMAMIGEQHSVSWVTCSAPLAQSPIDPATDSHAGRIETSLLLHLAPSTVDMALAVPGNTDTLGTLLPIMRTGGVAAVSPNGVLGDPTNATAAEGAQFFEAIVSSVTDLIAGGATDARGRLIARQSTPA